MKQKSISYLFVCFLLCLSVQVSYAQSIAAIKKRADAAFDKKEFETAKVDYRQLLAQNQKNIELNFKYATCIYYTEDIKNARRYYDLILAKKDAEFPLETYFYSGKIYQHQYYFETAIQQFNLLKEKNPKLALSLNVQAEIDACNSAIAGMKDMRTLQVIKKSQPFGEAFYDHYSFLDDSYSFYKAGEVFSKENSKRQFVPIYAFKRGMKFRVFASYGPESPNLDVYIQQKNENNEWGKPQKIQGPVNTDLDESYPFYDAENGYLYFSSKGHQTMGGFDLFRAVYSLVTNVSSDVENLHFPFSSPNDDYFYIPDLSNGNANFASNRNGKLSAIQTYLVNAAELPKELYFFTGVLSDKIDQSNSTVKLELIATETNERFGPFISQVDGSYLVGLPGPGTYLMEISVTGSNQIFKEELILPFVEEDMELQQELIYSMEDSKEKIQVVNRIKSKQVESMQMLSQKMNLAANLDVNLASFNRKVEISPQQKMQMEWGVDAKDTASLIAVLADSLLAAEVNLENQVRLTYYLADQLKEKQASLQQRMESFDQRMEKGSETLDPQLNEQWLQESKQLEQQLDSDLKDIQFLQGWLTANQQRGIPNIEVLKSLEEINQQIALLQYQQNSDGIMDLLTEKKELIKGQLSVAGEDLAAVIRTYSQEQERSQAEERAQFQVQKENQIQLEKQIEQLKSQASTLKGKEKIALDTQIQEKEQLNSKLKKELNTWSEQLNAQAKSSNLTYVQRESEVAEMLLSSEKMPLPTSNISFDLAKEQANNSAFVQQRLAQQQQMTVQEEKVKKWTSIDPTYAQDIAQINASNEDPIKRTELLKQRETIHVNQLKAAAARMPEVDQELLQEQIQLTENRVKSREEEIQNLTLSNSSLATNQSSSSSSETGQRTTDIENPTNETGQRTTANGQRTTETGQRTTENSQRTTENGNPTTANENPTTENGQQTTANGNPTTANENPTTENGQRTTANGNPTTENGQQTTANENPITANENPTSETGQRTTANENPTTENGQQTTANENPTTENGQQTTANENPTTETENPTTANENPTSETGQRTTANGNPTTETGQRTTDIGNPTTDIGNPTTETGQRTTDIENPTTENSQRSTVIGNPTTENGNRTTDIGNPTTETIQVEQVKETPRMASIEEAIRQIDLIDSQSITPKEKAVLKAELEATLVLEKRRAAVEESLELLGTVYPSVLELKQSYEQGQSDINSLNIQAVEQALQSENNPEKVKVLKAQLESLKTNQTIVEEQSITTIVTNPPLALPILTETPTNLTELQAQPAYVLYANKRLEFQQNMIRLDSLRQAKIQVEDSMRILLTQENEISIRKIEEQAKRHAKITEEINTNVLIVKERESSLKDFTEQASYEWMMQNGIQASSKSTESNVSSIISVLPSVPFSMTAVTTMNQVFPSHPINVPLPEGLIFRVQVGAFRKPVPNQLFREFGPVSGEVLTNGLTCYLAGYFNGSVDAVEARTMIRRLGYADAFIVAYCDGKRMSFNQGKALEVNGLCRKQSKEELQLALNQLVQQSKQEVQVPVAPVVVDPNSTEANQDLYFTVQVAVYNKPLTNPTIKGVNELLVTKTEKGQFRYSSGEFTSFAEARERKNQVVAKGIPDAYVVAYYRGKRISIGEANKLLAVGIVPKKRGEVVHSMEENISQVIRMVEIPVLKPLVKKDSIVQFELKVNEDNYLSQLTRLNRVGTFTYQAEKNRIISEKYLLDNISVNQQLYLSDMKRMRETKSKIPMQEFIVNPTRSECYDWLLRQSISYEARKENDVWIFRFYPDNKEQQELILQASEQFKWTLKE